MRNLDIAQLRALLAITEYGGVSQAANMLNLTQSAVSMQIKRLEETLDAALFNREGRRLALTASGELVRNYARKMISLNDEIYARINAPDPIEEMRIGIPPDVIEPYASRMLNEFREKYPDIRIQIHSDFSLDMLKLFEHGQLDLVITTEVLGHGQEIVRIPLQWYAAPNAKAHLKRPLPIAKSQRCAFSQPVKKALDEAEFDYEFLSNMKSYGAGLTMTKADLGVSVDFLSSPDAAGLEIIDDPSLPKLPDMGIYLYKNTTQASVALNDLAAIAEKNYRAIRDDY